MKILKRIRIKNKYLRSIRFVILVFSIFLCIIPLTIVNVIQLKTTEDKMVDQKMERLLGQCNIIRSHIVSEGFFENPDVVSVGAELSQLSAMYDGRIIVTDKNFRIIEDTYMMDNNKICISENVIKSFGGETISYYNNSEHYIEIALPIVSGDDTLGTMLVTFSTYDVREALKSIKNTCVLVDIIIIVILIAVSVYASKLFIKPFKEIEKSIDNISEGNLDSKIDVKGYTETVQISDAFNEMLEKIKKVDDS